MASWVTGRIDEYITAASKAGVAWVLPKCYGTIVLDAELGKENLTRPGVIPGIKLIEEQGVSSWIAMCSSFCVNHGGLANGGLGLPKEEIDGATR
ncbi:hypothetical protein MGU_06274 [Metarhizium guizhouense ARSEF 977]|uniref:Uncharacterized protein n=1 Tax=Metarhizium guizhouense (strain ARSEF 977) TaxID=1276136 RepID=A0A0B4H366_METGA|nr:hypothetical protein MGU_06274 [Metarhizium guizhouense ARSEF 977]